MKLSTLIKSTTAAIILSASMAAAQIPAQFANDPVVLQIAEQLATQGFEITEVKITLLGRYKIEATAPGFEREIVLAPGAGTVLRDEWRQTGSDDISGSNDDSSVDDNGTDDDGSDDNGSDDNGSDDNGSDDNGSDDNGSDDNGSDDNGSDDNGSDDNRSNNR